MPPTRKVQLVRSDPTFTSAVTRDGLGTTAFVYDPIGFTVTLQEAVAGPHSWVVTP